MFIIMKHCEATINKSEKQENIVYFSVILLTSLASILFLICFTFVHLVVLGNVWNRMVRHS